MSTAILSASASAASCRALIGAFPVDASPPRTAVVSETGGRSQIAGLAAVAIVIALLAFGASLLRQIPNAALGGVLLFVALRIIRVGQIVTIYRQSLGEFLLIVADRGRHHRSADRTGRRHRHRAVAAARHMEHDARPRAWCSNGCREPRSGGRRVQIFPARREPGIIVAGFQAPLSFLNAYHFRRDILEALKSSPQKPRLLVLEATGIVEIDFTAAQVLSDIIRKCHADGVDFAVARLELIRAQDAMARFGIDALLGPDRQFHSVEEAIQARGRKATIH